MARLHVVPAPVSSATGWIRLPSGSHGTLFGGFMSRTSARSSRDASDLYRAVWRWHFYAGLIAIPFLISLAVTGGLYLFKD
jgi:hypothetical protein